MNKSLQHIALIPDGNRRWAKKRGLPSIVGHEKGSSSFEQILEKTLELKIPYLTFWGLSLDNVLKRSKTEINYIYKIIESQFQKMILDSRIYENKVKVTVLGRYQDYFPEKTKKIIAEIIKKTKNHDHYHLTFLLAYNGTDEMVDCLRKIKEKKQNITEKTIKDNLWTKDLPAVDLIIRTGSEDDPHLSAGFMMWDSAYAQLYFTKTFFPDFKKKEFEKCVLDYFERQRRKGG
ncbi:MAG: polyprenyl diphosphate synthase [Candidatus Paceibacterota bacterium]|jgi:undecaprenyl diphosphate synthase